MAQGDPKEKLKRLHQTMVKDNYDVPQKFEDFERDMADENNLKSVRENLLKDGYDIPEWEVFSVDMGYAKKKEQSAPSTKPVSQGGVVSSQPSGKSGIGEQLLGGVIAPPVSPQVSFGPVQPQQPQQKPVEAKQPVESVMGEEPPTAKVANIASAPPVAKQNRDKQIVNAMSGTRIDMAPEKKEQAIDYISQQTKGKPYSTLSKEERIDVDADFYNQAQASGYMSESDYLKLNEGADFDLDKGLQVLHQFALGGTGVLTSAVKGGAIGLTDISFEEVAKTYKEKYKKELTKEEFDAAWSSADANRPALGVMTGAGPSVYRDMPDVKTAIEITKGKKAKEGGVFQWAEGVDKDLAKLLKTNPEWAHSFLLSKLPAGFGSAGAFVTTAVAGGLVGVPPWLGAGIVGAFVNGASQFEDALNKSGGDYEKAMKAFNAGLAPGALEGAAYTAWVGKLIGKLSGSVSNSVLKAVVKGFERGTPEAVQESVTSILNNASAQRIYDASREILNEETWESGAIGMITGILLNGLATKKQNAKPDERRIIERTENMVREMGFQKMQERLETLFEKGDLTFNEQVEMANLRKALKDFGKTVAPIAPQARQAEEVVTQEEVVAPNAEAEEARSLIEMVIKGRATLDDSGRAEFPVGARVKDAVKLLEANGEDVAAYREQLGLPVGEVITEEKIEEQPLADPTAETPAELTPESPITTEEAAQGEPKIERTQEEFQDENEFYRIIVGDESFNDIVESGVVRTNAGKKTKGGSGIELGARPTAFPSFSKGKASMAYAGENPNHYIVVTADKSIQPSKSGRHGKGTTMFPTDENGNHLAEISGDKVRVYKHVGDGKYALVYANGAVVEAQQSVAKEAAQEDVVSNTIEPQMPATGAQGAEVVTQGQEQITPDTQAGLTPEVPQTEQITPETQDEPIVEGGSLTMADFDTYVGRGLFSETEIEDMRAEFDALLGGSVTPQGRFLAEDIQQQKGGQNAIPEQISNEGVLREEGQELGLQGVEQGNAGQEGVAEEGLVPEIQEEITSKQDGKDTGEDTGVEELPAVRGEAGGVETGVDEVEAGGGEEAQVKPKTRPATKKAKRAKLPKVLYRVGDIKGEMAHFATDTDNAIISANDRANVSEYEVSPDAQVADVTDKSVVAEIKKEALSQAKTEAEKKSISAWNGENTNDRDNEQNKPLIEAAKRLGYDGWVYPDITDESGNPTSLNLWDTQKVKKVTSVDEARRAVWRYNGMGLKDRKSPVGNALMGRAREYATRNGFTLFFDKYGKVKVVGVKNTIVIPFSDKKVRTEDERRDEKDMQKERKALLRKLQEIGSVRSVVLYHFLGNWSFNRISFFREAGIQDGSSEASPYIGLKFNKNAPPLDLYVKEILGGEEGVRILDESDAINEVVETLLEIGGSNITALEMARDMVGQTEAEWNDYGQRYYESLTDEQREELDANPDVKDQVDAFLSDMDETVGDLDGDGWLYADETDLQEHYKNYIEYENSEQFQADIEESGVGEQAGTGTDKVPARKEEAGSLEQEIEQARLSQRPKKPTIKEFEEKKKALERDVRGIEKKIAEAKKSGVEIPPELLEELADKRAQYKAHIENEGKYQEAAKQQTSLLDEIADTIRKAKIDTKGKAFDATIGLPIAVWNGAIEVVAKAVEGGVALAEAAQRGLNYIQKNHRGQWNKKEYNTRVLEEMGLRGISVNGEDLVVKPVQDKVMAKVVEGLYSPMEDAIATAKKESATGKEWKRILDGATEAEEWKWTGLGEYLEDGKTYSKADLLKFMEENRVQVVEVEKGLKDVDDLNEEDALLLNERARLIIDERDDIKTFQEAREAAYDELFGEYGTPTKFSEYQLPGEKENYKELLVLLPSKVGAINAEITKKVGESPEWKAHIERMGKLRNDLDNGIIDNSEFEIAYEEELDEGGRIQDRFADLYKKRDGADFKSSHFNEPNILVHLRMNTRTGANGEKVLFIEEVQSDWGQKGKKEGFRSGAQSLPQGYEVVNDPERFTEEGYDNPNGYFVVDFNGDVVGWGETKDKALADYFAFDAGEGIAGGTIGATGIPSAPFVTDTNAWVKLGLKFALKEAVAQGADVVAWTTGEQQFERWGSEEIHWELDNEQGGEKTFSVNINEQTNNAQAFAGNEEAMRENRNMELDVLVSSKEELRDAIKKNLSRERNDSEINKLTDRIWNRMQTEDSGTSMPRKEGMEKFYGDPKSKGIVGSVAESLVKDLTGEKGKVGEVEIQTAKDNEYTLGEANYIGGVGVYDEKGDMVAEFNTEKEAKKYITSKEAQQQPSIPITPELKASVKQGMPLFGAKSEALKKSLAERLAEAKAKLDKTIRDAGGQLNSGIDPGMMYRIMRDATRYGALLIEQGITDFKVWSAKLLKEFPELKDYAKSLWEEQTIPKRLDPEGRTLAEYAKAKEKEKGWKEDKGDNERSFIARYRGIDEASEEAQTTDPDVAIYETISHAQTREEVEAVIKERGFENAVLDYFNTNIPMSPRQRVALGMGLLSAMTKQEKKLRKEGTPDAKLLEQIQKLKADIAILGTELGQGVDAFRIFNEFLTGPEQAVVLNRRMIDRVNRRALKDMKPLIDKVRDTIKGSNAASAGQAVDQVVAEQGKKKASKTARAAQKFGMTEQEYLDKKAKLRNEILGGGAFSGISPQNLGKMVEYGRMVLTEGAITVKDWLAEMKASFPGVEMKDLKKVWDENLAAEADRIRKEAKKGQDEFKTKLRDVVTRHFAGEPGSLAEKLEAELGLDEIDAFLLADKEVAKREKAAERLADKIEKQYEKQREKDKKKLENEIRKLLPKAAVTGGKFSQDNIDKLIEATKKGATPAQVRQAFADMMNMASVNPEVEARLEEMATEIADMPDGQAKRQKIQNMMTLMADQQGIKGSDIAWSLWYAGLLSGTTTHSMNFVSTGLSVLEDVFVKGIGGAARGDITRMLRLFNAMRRGLGQGILTFADVMATGEGAVKHGEKIGIKNVLERSDAFTPGWARTGLVQKYTQLAKFVPRLMAASDAIWYRAATEVSIENQLANDAVAMGGVNRFNPKGIAEYVRRKRGFEEARVKAARVQAEAEATEKFGAYDGLSSLKKSQWKKFAIQRRAEILNEALPEDVFENAKAQASRVTFNYEPEGVLGAIADAIGLLKKVPVAKIPANVVFPFVRTVVNVLNRQLDYMPPVAATRLAGYQSKLVPIEKQVGPMKWKTAGPKNQQDAYEAYTRAALAMVLMTALYLNNPDDDEEEVIIHGRGPSDPDLYWKWRNQGGMPNSIQVGDKYYSYLYTPWGFALSIVGNMRDAGRYQEDDDKERDKVGEQLGVALSTSASNLLDMSFLTGLSGLMQVMAPDKTKSQEQKERALARYIAQTATSAIPNIAKQVNRAFDPQVYSATSFKEYLLRNLPIPGTAVGLKPMLNVWGEPITKTSTTLEELTVGRMVSTKKEEPLTHYVVRKGLDVKMPQTIKRVNPTTGVEESMKWDYPGKWYEFNEKFGKVRASFVKENMRDWEESETEVEEIQKEIDKFSKEKKAEILEEMKWADPE